MEESCGHLHPSFLSGQEAELEHRRQLAQPVHLWREVDVFWGLGTGQGEALQHGGQKEEELGAGQALTQTDAFSWGTREVVLVGEILGEHPVAPPILPGNLHAHLHRFTHGALLFLFLSSIPTA